MVCANSRARLKFAELNQGKNQQTKTNIHPSTPFLCVQQSANSTGKLEKV